MYSLLTEFRDGDNVVTTMMEHNSNYVPWYAMCREILPRLGRQVDYRLARFDPVTGELDLDHLASLVDARTKLVCCTGASNFLGTRTPLAAVRALADASGYLQPDGERRSYLLVDGAQLVPGSFVDVQALGVDFLAFSFHKMLAPFGVGVLYAREHLLESVAAVPVRRRHDRRRARVPRPGRVQRAALEVRRRNARTSSARSSPRRRCACCWTWRSRRTRRLLRHGRAHRARRRARGHGPRLRLEPAADQPGAGRARRHPGITIYGPLDPARRTSLVAFNLAGRDPVSVAEALNRAGVESRAGCHCATLAHHALGLTPPASCRLSFYLYNTPDEVDRAANALHAIVAGPPLRTRRRWGARTNNTAISP